LPKPHRSIARARRGPVSKFEGKVSAQTYRDCEYTVESAGQDLGRARLWSSFTWFEGRSLKRERIGTPCGTLSHTWEYQRETGAPFEREHWWKDWSNMRQSATGWNTPAPV